MPIWVKKSWDVFRYIFTIGFIVGGILFYIFHEDLIHSSLFILFLFIVCFFPKKVFNRFAGTNELRKDIVVLLGDFLFMFIFILFVKNLIDSKVDFAMLIIGLFQVSFPDLKKIVVQLKKRNAERS